MTYQELTQAMARYGSTEQDICLHAFGVLPEQICNTVLIAPWWEPKSLPALGEATPLFSDPSAQGKLWEIRTEQGRCTFIKTGVGAPNFADAMLALGTTPCRRALFLGSVGALDPAMEIGDLLLPHTAVSGDGVSRYLCSDRLGAQDSFGSCTFPTPALFSRAEAICRTACQTITGFHTAKVFSTDTIFAQFYHLEAMMALGCTAIDMETAAFFACGALMDIECAAFHIVSDNTLHRQSLVSGRTEETEQRRKAVRRQLLPSILTQLI